MELKKHVAVIHSNSKISLLQRKISNALLFHAYDDLLTKDEHQIQVSTLTKLIGYDSHDHKRIKQSLMDLLATVVEWNIVDGDKIDKNGTWNASSIISDASISGSLCSYSYSNKMRNLLHHPSVYGRLNMQVQALFQSSYGLALYENCNRYQDIGQTPWFELDKFRKLMGVDDDKYKIFRDFKSRVLDKSVEEVNKYSSLIVEPVLRKINRQVVAIQFLIKKNNCIEVKCVDAKLEQNSLLSILKDDYAFSQKQIRDLCTTFEEHYIHEKIKLVESSPSFISGKIKNLGKYLLCALNDDYQPIKNAIQNNQKKDMKTDDNKLSLYQQYVRNIIFMALDNSDGHDRSVFFEGFERYIKKTMYAHLYAQDGLKNILVEDQFIKYVLNKKNWLTINILPYSQWMDESIVAANPSVVL